MNFTQDTTGQAVNGTSLVGYVKTTYARLVEVFGQPTFTNDADAFEKTQAEWVIVFDNGLVASIYDWKQYEAGVPQGLYDWHIGGTTEEVVNVVVDALQ